ncbi:MAG: stage III sporulation protein AC [Lachnospiraceae bacterium]|nr:stage III sporulation protein AC [Lachnospiraceae bacterium]
MDIYLIFKIAAVGILVSVVGQILKASGREEQAFLASLAGLLLVLSWVLPYIAQLFQLIDGLFQW